MSKIPALEAVLAAPVTETLTKILLDVDRGVIVADKPVTATKLPVVTLALKASVLVVDTTWRIPPDRDTAPIH
jgi:hypothetical protein